MPQWLVTDMSLLLPAVLLTVMLALFVLTDAYIGRDHRKVLLIISALMLSLIAQNYCDMLLQGRYVNTFLRTVVSVIGYILRPVILVLFCHVVNPKGRFRLAWALTAVNGAVYLTAFFSSLTFWIGENNHYHGGPLRYTCHFISAILLFYLLFLSVREFQTTGVRNNWVLLLSVLLIIGSVVMDNNIGVAVTPISFLTIAIVLSGSFYYVWLHLQFVRSHEKELLAGQRVQIMLSQIKPHFLYNALGAIEELCDSDPPKAKAATARFSEYLRGNMNAISAEGMIPFAWELSHTKMYLELEQLRFEDALQVRYDIGSTDFSIPALTLEPIVENAVRHGVRAKPDGRGTVLIATAETQNDNLVIVTDDGPGFDPDTVPDDGRSHVGIRNVRERLETVCGGSLVIESIHGQGTKAIIRIPKAREG